MKKVFFYFLLSLFINSFLIGQSINLNFTALFNGSRIQIDSVLIKNITQDCDTTIYWPDTLLNLFSNVGYFDFAGNNSNLLNVNIFPNPSFDYTNINLLLYRNGNLNINIYDVLGKNILNFNENVHNGFYNFVFYPGKERFYILCVDFNGEKKSYKIINLGLRLSKESISLSEDKSFNFNLNKSSKANFNWLPSDTLLYTGYFTIFQNLVGSSYIYDTPFQNSFYVFNKIIYSCINEPILYDARDSNYYNTVQIGNQCWMAENLKYLPFVVPPSNGGVNGTNQYCYVNGYNFSVVSNAKETLNYKRYGVLYNWHAIMNGSNGSNTNPSGVQGICPFGWHVPSLTEYEEMFSYLVSNGYNWDTLTNGNFFAKSIAGQKFWNTTYSLGTIGCNLTANNSSGFSALPGGSKNLNGSFDPVGEKFLFWTATQDLSSTAISVTAQYYAMMVSSGWNNKNKGFSCRCVKD